MFSSYATFLFDFRSRITPPDFALEWTGLPLAQIELVGENSPQRRPGAAAPGERERERNRKREINFKRECKRERKKEREREKEGGKEKKKRQRVQEREREREGETEREGEKERENIVCSMFKSIQLI